MMWTRIKVAAGRSRELLHWHSGRCLELAKRVVRPIPLVNTVGRYGYRRARWLKRHWPTIGKLAKRCRQSPTYRRILATAFLTGGVRALRETAPMVLPGFVTEGIPLHEWLGRFRPDPELLAWFRARRWPARAPKFTILMPVYNVREDWLRQAVSSVIDQTYPRWELICVNDGSTADHIRPTLDDLAAGDSRVRVMHLGHNRGVSIATNLGLEAATGQYVCLMDHDDYLEPHALHRFAETILREAPELLYSDEAITSEDLGEILQIPARCQFSYDYYISHPYFVHLIGVRADLLRGVGGLNEEMTISQDVDLILRLIEVCKTISYVPDVLYRWRTHPESLGHQEQAHVQAMTRGALERHFCRIGVDATIDDSTHFNFRDIQIRSTSPARVAVLIPTKNHAALLRTCIESLERTIDPRIADIVVIDHQSDDPETRTYLDGLRLSHRVIPYKGPFNYSAIMNHGVAAVRGPYTHYLFLNNDIEAIEPGWLDHMLTFGQRRDVGIVGAVLLYPDKRVQHAGVIIGLHCAAEHAHKFWQFRDGERRRNKGQNGSLLANREFSAVTAACMLMRADAFDDVGGFDETLVVGFNDTDLCLRTRALGYKVIHDAKAVLYHHESQTRGTSPEDPHPLDSARFIRRHRKMIVTGDPFYSPLLTKLSTACHLNPTARASRRLRALTTQVMLPIPDTMPRIARVECSESMPQSRGLGRPHLGVGGSHRVRQGA